MITRFAKRITRSVFSSFGYEILPLGTMNKVKAEELPADLDDSIVDLYRAVKPYTMTSVERIAALCNAVNYVISNNIDGDIVECGVWKGGSMMAVAKTLLANKTCDRELHLFDTFEGMPPPTQVDVTYKGHSAADLLERASGDKEQTNIWAIGPLQTVKEGMQSTGYDQSKVNYVQGRVEDTLPSNAPDKISLLRLDTDWYESTFHEMVHLFPRLSVGGVLIIDDYGHWKGARKAIDKYIADNNIKLLLNRIDYTGRICVKVEP